MEDQSFEVAMGVKAFDGLLRDFRNGNIANKKAVRQSIIFPKNWTHD